MATQVPDEFRALLLEGLERFDRGDYHDAHDVLEEIWLDEVGQPRRLMQAIIQLSVGLYHRGRGNQRGARKLLRRAGEILGELDDDVWGFDLPRLIGACSVLADEVDRQDSEPEPVYDPALIPSFAEDRARLQ